MTTFEFKDTGFEGIVNKNSDAATMRRYFNRRQMRATEYSARCADRRAFWPSILKMALVIFFLIIIFILAGMKIMDVVSRQPREITVPEGDRIVYEEYVIHSGDTLISIAADYTQESFYRRCDLMVAIKEKNRIQDPNHIKIGDRILIPQIIPNEYQTEKEK